MTSTPSDSLKAITGRHASSSPALEATPKPKSRSSSSSSSSSSSKSNREYEVTFKGGSTTSEVNTAVSLPVALSATPAIKSVSDAKLTAMLQGSSAVSVTVEHTSDSNFNVSYKLPTPGTYTLSFQVAGKSLPKTITLTGISPPGAATSDEGKGAFSSPNNRILRFTIDYPGQGRHLEVVAGTALIMDIHVRDADDQYQMPKGKLRAVAYPGRKDRTNQIDISILSDPSQPGRFKFNWVPNIGKYEVEILYNSQMIGHKKPFILTVKRARDKISSNPVDRFLQPLRSNDPTLLNLSLDLLDVGDEGAGRLALALAINTILITLGLKNNKINDEGMGRIATTLVTNTALTSLDLSGNNISDDGGEMLATALAFNTTLTALDLRGNNIGDRGAGKFVRVLTSNTTLITLHISENKISEPVQNRILSEIDVNNNLNSTLDSYFGITAHLESFYRDQILDFSGANLHVKVCERFPFQSTWHDVRVIDFRNNPNLSRVPRSLGHLNPLTTQEIYFDDNDEWDAEERTLARYPAGKMLTVLKFHVTLDLALIPYHSQTGVLDMKDLLLDDILCSSIQFMSTDHLYQRIDFRNNPKITQIPRSIGHLNPLTTRDILFDPFPLYANDENRYLQLDTPTLIRVMKFKLQYDPPKINLHSYFSLNSQSLDLRRLNLDNGQALRLPLYEPYWWTIQRIDLTKNPQLTQIPACLGFLDPQITTRIDLDIDKLMPSVQTFAASGCTAIISYAKGLLEGNLVRLNQVKMLVVGRAAVGKTTLVRSLYGEKFDPRIPSTDGIDLGEFVEEGIRFMTWDFGGQRVYRYTHQLFLTSNSLYLVLFKLTDQEAQTLKELRFWLSSIASRVVSARVLLIGTHLDGIERQRTAAKSISDIILQIVQVLSSEFPQLVLSNDVIHAVSCIPGKESTLKDLRHAILNAAKEVTIEAPESFVIAQSYFSSLTLFPPLIPYNEALQVLRSRIPGSSDDQLGSVLQVLDRLGLVSVFHLPRSPSGGLIILRPQWLAKLLSTIVTTKHRLVNDKSGLISQRVLSQSAWIDRYEFPPEKHGDLIDVLVQMEILFPIGEGQYFIPCMLRENAPELGFYIPCKVTRDSRIKLQRVVKLQGTSVPVAVIPPLLIGLSQHGQLIARWQQGCIARFRTTSASEVWLQLSKERGDQISVMIWGDCAIQTTHWLRRITEMIITRLTEFYHLPYSINIPCPYCRHASSLFSFETLQNCVREHQLEVRCAAHLDIPLRIDRLAPDLMFVDLRGEADGFIFEFDKMTRVRELGQGAFGRVLLMTMPFESGILLPTSSSSSPDIDSKSQRYAIKLLERKSSHTCNSSADLFTSFIQEVYLQSCLRHPNVVRLHGICLPPNLAMVMEVVDGGDLYGQLIDPLGLKSRVFGFTKSLIEEVSGYVRKLESITRFRFIFEHRNRFSATTLHNFEEKCRDVLISQPDYISSSFSQEQQQQPFSWIDYHYAEGIRNAALNDLESRSVVDFYGIPEDEISVMISPLAPFEEICNGGYRRAEEAFERWQSHVTGSQQQEVLIMQSQYFDTIQLVYSDRTSKESIVQMRNLEDKLQVLALLHLEYLAPINMQMRLKLAGDIVRGMVYLHELNPPMVHRDLKTPNIFMMRSLIHFPQSNLSELSKPLAKVGDFGLSVRLACGSELQVRDRDENDLLMNINPTWAAPELLSGGRYSTAIDVYAMGIILWELLVRAHPFEEVSMNVLREHVIAGNRLVFSDAFHNDPHHASYISLSERCWHQDPSMRPIMRQIYEELFIIASSEAPELIGSVLTPLPIAPTLSEDRDKNVATMAWKVTSHHLKKESIAASFLPAPPPPSSSSPSKRCTMCHREFGLFNKRLQCKHCQKHACKSCLPKCSCSSMASAPMASSMSAPSASDSLSVLRISCMMFPFDGQEILWMGFDDGQVGVSVLKVDPTQELVVKRCGDHDRHQLRVNVMVSATGSEEGGTIWTGSEDGSLSVWSSRLLDENEIKETSAIQGNLSFSQVKKGKSVERMRNAWFELDGGLLCWFKKRYDINALGNIDVLAIENLHIQDLGDNSRITLQLPNSQSLILASASREWCRKLNNIFNLRINPSGVVRIASYQSASNAGILSLTAMDHTVWSASTDFSLTQWTLSSTADEHGLHRSYYLQVGQVVQLDASHLPSRLRSIAGFVRVSEDVFWVAVGNRWVVIDTATEMAGSKITWMDELPSSDQQYDKFVSVCSIENHSSREVWTVDHSGLVCIWGITSTQTNDFSASPSHPLFLGSVMRESWNEEEDGRPCCMIQATEDLVFVGSSRGRILAIDVESRQLIETSQQPLPGGHPCCHSRGVYTIASLPGVTDPVIWSASSDRKMCRIQGSRTPLVTSVPG